MSHAMNMNEQIEELAELGPHERVTYVHDGDDQHAAASAAAAAAHAHHMAAAVPSPHHHNPPPPMAMATPIRTAEGLNLQQQQEPQQHAEGMQQRRTDKPSGKDFKGGQQAWQAMLYQFLLFRARNGPHAVPKPSSKAEEKQIHQWVQQQRKHTKLFRQGHASSMTEDRLAVLESINFPWNFRGDSFWQKNYDALKAYKAQNGHCMVPRNWEEDPKLGEWVTDQRRQWKHLEDGKPSLMTADRKARLDALGFTWRIRDRTDWNDRYEQLVQYKNEHGNCIVPQHYAKNKQLGKWTAKQREQYRFLNEGKHSFLNEERVKKLEAVGFVWSIKGRRSRPTTGKKQGEGKEVQHIEQHEQHQVQQQHHEQHHVDQHHEPHQVKHHEPHQVQHHEPHHEHHQGHHQPEVMNHPGAAMAMAHQQQQQQQQQQQEQMAHPGAVMAMTHHHHQQQQQQQMVYAASLSSAVDAPDPMPHHMLPPPGPSPIHVHEPLPHPAHHHHELDHDDVGRI